MEIAECCRQSRDAYDYADDPRFFLETQRRNPIGWEIIFFDCQYCGSQWKRQREAFQGGDLYWVRLQPQS